MNSGEIALAKRLNLLDQNDPYELRYSPSMPLQHQIFFSNLPYFVFGTLDSKGRPWVTLMTGNSGFISSVNENRLRVDAQINKWDPTVRNLENGVIVENGSKLFSGLGVDFSNRRRNKVAGEILTNSIKLKKEEGKERAKVNLLINTTESLGNCPKYINIRAVKYAPRPTPQLVHDSFELPADFAGLPKECIETIHQADTIFIATRHYSNPGDIIPISDMDVNIRGGLRGFVRISLDGRQIIWPDYSGNRFYQSLGNVESDHLAGMVLPNFTTGDILYVTGTAENLIGDEARAVLPTFNLITRITITGFIFIKQGLDLVLQDENINYSPYCPPVQYLLEESHLYPAPPPRSSAPSPLTLTSITPLSKNVVSFHFTLPSPLTYLPGQYILIDFSQVIKKSYAHMNDKRPQFLNDDLVRSWTISSSSLSSLSSSLSPTTTLTCTIKLKEAGLITPLLHHCASLPSLPLLSLQHRGINGEFSIFLPPPSPSSPLQLENPKMLFLAGGIGITPFLSFFSALTSLPSLHADVALLFSCRGDEIGLADPLLSPSLAYSPIKYFKIFQTGEEHASDLPAERRRMEKKDIEGIEGVKERLVLMCGPDGYLKVVVGWLEEIGVPAENVRFEKFNF